MALCTSTPSHLGRDIATAFHRVKDRLKNVDVSVRVMSHFDYHKNVSLNQELVEPACVWTERHPRLQWQFRIGLHAMREAVIWLG